MFKSIIELLKYSEQGKSELIDIAKGKYKLPINFKDLKKQIKWHKKK